MFNHDGNIQYLNLLAELKMRADMDVQQADALNTLLKKSTGRQRRCSSSLQQDGSFANLLNDIHLATSTIRGTHAMNVLQDLFSAFGNNPTIWLAKLALELKPYLASSKVSHTKSFPLLKDHHDQSQRYGCGLSHLQKNHLCHQ